MHYLRVDSKKNDGVPDLPEILGVHQLLVDRFLQRDRLPLRVLENENVRQSSDLVQEPVLDPDDLDAVDGPVFPTPVGSSEISRSINPGNLRPGDRPEPLPVDRREGLRDRLVVALEDRRRDRARRGRSSSRLRPRSR